MKNLIKDESAVSYLLLVGFGFTIVIVGIAYMFTSDFVDYILAAINNYEGTPLEGQMDSSSIEGGNFLIVLFKLFLIPALLILSFWVWSMSQRPFKPY